MTDQNSTLTKTCTGCKAELPATQDHFYRQERGLYGLRSICRTCSSEKRRAARQKEYWADPEAARAKSARFRAENREKVIRLRKESYYRRRDEILARGRADRESRKDEINAARREQYAKRAEFYRMRQREDRLKNREARVARARAYRQRNLEVIRAQERAYGLKKYYRRYKSDLGFTLKMRTSALLRTSLRGGLKSKKTEDVLGYTIQELRAHLESGFRDGMTWERFLAGDIHIDHIRPVSSFEITGEDCPEFKKCWALDNLQPLWAEDNIRKGAKYDPAEVAD